MNDKLGNTSLRAKNVRVNDKKKNNKILILKFVSSRVEKIVGKEENCWLTAFSPIPTGL